MIDELNSWDIQGDQMESESGVNRSNADDVRSLDIQGVQLERESGVTRSIIDELHSIGYPTRSNGRRKWCYSK